MAEPRGAFGESPLERPNWFEGRPVTAAGLDEQQHLFRERQRRRNRLLHGWGIVTGLSVSRASGLTVAVEPGFALDASGNEILVPDLVVVDVRASGLERARDTHWLAVRWDESPSGELPSGMPDVPEMTASWREDAEFAVLDETPLEAPDDAVHAAAPWLVLATLVWDGDDVLEVDTSVQHRLTAVLPHGPNAGAPQGNGGGATPGQVPVEP